MWKLVRRLHESGVLGINGRNALYTQVYNPRHFYPLVDDKLQTKQLAQKAGIAVPELYGVIQIEHQTQGLPKLLETYPDFVIKPAAGSGGDGIIVITGRAKGLYRKSNGQLINENHLAHHVSNILSGMFSLGGHPDKALIEYRVRFDPVFQTISFQGVPDVRIIVFQGIPLMSMVRLPTRMSDGKANLHQGAIGAGIDLTSGKTLNAVWHNSLVDEHPDTGVPITGIQIPHWDRLLELAARCCELTGLGYIGVDLVLDEQLGPLILELNARPGLNIQIANRVGLLNRLRQVEQLPQALTEVSDRVAFAKTHFGATPLDH
jgi:alpha-L-glutamate ligase-like protein